MQSMKSLLREGDANFTHNRKLWNDNLDENTVDIIGQDERVFLRQSMSTPCMNAVSDVEGCYIIDTRGKRYLDFHGNSVHQVGHKNKYVIEKIKNQLDELPFIPRRYTSDIAVKAADALINKTTSKNFKVLFTPSGSAAVGLALKVARKVTGRHKVISMWESFHGAGLDTISVGGEYVFKKDIGPLMPGAIKSIPYNGYRNLINSDDNIKVSDFCLDYLEYIIENEGEIGAILLEPIRATDTHVPPKEYFKRLRKICDENKILLIFDEIPTCLGRSGEFYVHQNFGIEPDILVLGKGLGGGIVPQAAVLVNKRYDVAEDISLGHYTHEKPAIGCAAICAAIEYIDENNLMDNCRELSQFAMSRGKELMNKYNCIGDFRIQGLLISFEFVKDRITKEKDTDLSERILYSSLEEGLSFKVSSGNCITWHPPLVLSKEELEFAFDIFEKAIIKNQS
ncbi:(R)-1-hydroxy-2-aminoethylphosphonate ammonia-lyase [Clostridium butyricum]|uniref:4-aminobutyrate transaminase n=1 Tax=Clostridium butyricum E4 str. BoNT E BL5262 TaxID=632245 RepID=C4ILQ1_CLOBU|nr:aspartate aminotransferase family protein [Clostridium butyricum]EDT75779.1 4-aminobutyrate aminotransferase [Clostridium butyricum 5521]EEP52678.1 4-aminobutyrate transaminase [Clostridium butyricum E4 str. BoNT E BL5262]NFL29872.1 aspartate aminotransferase family protein [Clostridium butyricum]NFS17521.1 aspartate aminotransferase family protein [Clostridium butyricum]